MADLLFPMFLKLQGRTCLVVGAGTVAEAKVESLLDAGATVTVIAPGATAQIVRYAGERRIRWMRRTFEPADLSGMFLAIAATSDHEVNRAVFEEAQRLGVLCNSVDDPPHCDFYFPAVIRRGSLQIAISTAGESPALAQRLRRELDQVLDRSLGSLLDRIGIMRRRILARHPPSGTRSRLLKLLAYRDVCDLPCCPGAKEPGEELARGRWPMKAAIRKTGTAARAATVYLVGAGPGDPELLTLKAASLIRTADLVLHDDLVPQAILTLAGRRTKVVSVGKRCGRKRVTQEQINDLMISSALRGFKVVRLKGGDPLIFARLGEELDALRQAGIPFEVVPGISAGSAAAATLGISLTDRRFSSQVLMMSGHHARDAVYTVEEDLGRLDLESTTLMVYMPGADLSTLRRRLLDAGLDPAISCVVVSRATRPDQREVRTSLEELHRVPELEPPSLLLVGRQLGGNNRTIRTAERHSSGIQVAHV